MLLLLQTVTDFAMAIVIGITIVIIIAIITTIRNFG